MRRMLCIAVVAAVVVGACGPDGEPRTERASNRDAYVLTPEQRSEVQRQQAAHTGRGDPARGRDALLRRVERSILADARARVRARELDGPIVRVTCEQSRRTPTAYACTAVTNELSAADHDPHNAEVTGVTGHPFRAVVDFASGRYAWCKRILVPGEGGVIDPRAVVPLPEECIE